MTKRLWFFLLVFLCCGCSPLRHYELARNGPHDTSAGDITHVSEPGAKVVVPKGKKQ